MSRYLQDEAAARFPIVTVNGRDMMAWAKRLHWRDEQGDKTLMPIQVQFAKEALGIETRKAEK